VQSAPTAPTVRQAPDRPRRAEAQAERPSPVAMAEEVLDLCAGLGILLLPLWLTAVPGIILFFVLPAVLLLAVTAVPAIILAAIVAPPYLLIRFIVRRRARR
jgi:hypothetical protein